MHPGFALLWAEYKQGRNDYDAVDVILKGDCCQPCATVIRRNYPKVGRPAIAQQYSNNTNNFTATFEEKRDKATGACRTAGALAGGADRFHTLTCTIQSNPKAHKWFRDIWSCTPLRPKELLVAEGGKGFSCKGVLKYALTFV